MLAKDIAKMPSCQSESENECFSKALGIVQNSVDVQPCTKLEYGVSSVTQQDFTQKHIASFRMAFDPPKVNVREEYLIYDLVSMISAIGGTMGLCVGFSFTDIANNILTFAEDLVNSITRQQTKFRSHLIGSRKAIKPHQPSIEEMTTCIQDLKSQVYEYEVKLFELTKQKDLAYQ